MSPKLLLLFVSFFVLLSASSSPGAADTALSEETIEIKVGMLPYASYAPLYIAEAEGFYEE